MRLIDFLNFIIVHGDDEKIEFIVLYVNSKFIFKCHLDDLFFPALEHDECIKSAFITLVNYNCKQLHIEAECDE